MGSAQEGEGARRRPPAPPQEAREEALALRWDEQVIPGGPWRTEEGLEVMVLEGGTPARAPGPDRRDALVAWSGGRLQWGDIELHRRDGDWLAHGHHRDPRYEGVILHVVFRARGTRTPLANGGSAPLLALERNSFPPPPQGAFVPRRCPFLPRTLAPSEVVAVLGTAGDARFEGKIAGFRQELREAAADEVLYRALLEGLGYSANRQPLRLLAEGLPWSASGGLGARLRAVPSAEREALARALLLGSAGFLEGSGRPEGAEGCYEPLGALWRRAGLPQVLERGAWEVWGQRPANHPRRRLEGAAVLVARWAEAGPSAILLRPLRGQQRPSAKALSGILTVPRLRKTAPAALGEGRARALVVNVVLPFAAAWAQEQGERRLGPRAWESFRGHPPLPPNAILRFVAQRLWDGAKPPLPLGARHQQGLHELYRRCCGSGEPWRCPFTTGVGRWSGGPGKGRAAGPDASERRRRQRS